MRPYLLVLEALGDASPSISWAAIFSRGLEVTRVMQMGNFLTKSCLFDCDAITIKVNNSRNPSAMLSHPNFHSISNGEISQIPAILLSTIDIRG